MTSQFLAHLGENNGGIAREEDQGGTEVSGNSAARGQAGSVNGHREHGEEGGVRLGHHCTPARRAVPGITEEARCVC